MDYDRLFRKDRPTFFTLVMDLGAFDAFADRVRDHAADRDADAWRIRGKKARTRRGFFDELGAVLQLPHYFGENWDALNDIMYSHAWMPGTLFLMSEAQLLLNEAAPQDLANLVQLFDKCNRFYQTPPYDTGSSNYTGFHALLQVSAEELLPEVEQRFVAVGAELEAFQAAD